MAAAALFAETRGLAPRSRPERAVRARSGFIKIIIVVFASIAGVINVFATSPLWVVYARFAAAKSGQKPPYKSIRV